MPSAPDTPIVASQTSNSLTISWTAPNGQGSPVTDYQVRMCVGQSVTCTFTTVATTTNGATQLAMTGLSKGTFYQF